MTDSSTCEAGTDSSGRDPDYIIVYIGNNNDCVHEVTHMNDSTSCAGVSFLTETVDPVADVIDV